MLDPHRFTSPELAEVEVNRIKEEIRKYKSGEVDEEVWRRFRLENGVYGIRFQKDIQMIRVKIP